MLPLNCTKRKSEYRIHKLLSNGQWLNLYFIRSHNPNGFNVWTTGLCINNKTRVANDWFNKLNKNSRKVEGKCTGKCGLEGLKRALDYICDFADRLGNNEELQVGWADNRRKYAYRRLLKYNFFIDEELKVYHTRNLNYWRNTGYEEKSNTAYIKR